MVVAILAFFAGLVTYNLAPNQLTFGSAGGGKTVGVIATEATLTRVKTAIFGSSQDPGYWQDMNRDMWYYPRYLEWLSRSPSEVGAENLTDEELRYHSAMMNYSPSRRVGWRGPYIQFEGKIIPLSPNKGFTARLGGGLYRSPIDAWGNPIIVQWPSSHFGDPVDFGNSRGDTLMALFVSSNTRLVSAGADGILQTELNLNSLQSYEEFLLNPELAGDDIVVWLQR